MRWHEPILLVFYKLIVGVDDNASCHKLKGKGGGGQSMEEFVKTKPGAREIGLLDPVDQATERIAESAQSY